MQQPPRRPPSPGINLLIAVLLGIPGVINLVAGTGRGNVGEIICGIAAIAYALLLARDALHVKKTGRPAMPQGRMLLVGFGFLGVYLIGLFLKHSG